MAKLATSSPTLLNIPTEGYLQLSTEQLQQAGFNPGDDLMISIAAPCHIYLHKVHPLFSFSASLEDLRELIKKSFYESGYDTPDKIVNLTREIRKEMVNKL